MSASIPFAGLTIEAARRVLAAHLKDNGIETHDLDARLLLGAALDLDHTGLAVQAARKITDDEAKIIGNHAQRRGTREPVARILGRKEFWGLDLHLSDDTLVPRPDTETVVETALDILRSESRAGHALRIADIGTGSGAILLALLSELPIATGVGTDISAGALATAEINAQRLCLASRASFIRCDYAATLAGPFDLIVSNPPYVRSADITALDPDVRDHDPLLALDGGADGLDAYRAIIPQTAGLLASNGILIVEVGYDQSALVAEMMHAAGLTLPRLPEADLAGIHRAVTGRKTAV
ncbi:peptide chain release factor N(5)-glutamine methyltransferase [soil metagenome]